MKLKNNEQQDSIQHIIMDEKRFGMGKKSSNDLFSHKKPLLENESKKILN